MKNSALIYGKLFLAKCSGIFGVAFVLAGEDEEGRHQAYSLSDERTVARMLYTNGYVDEPHLFQLVTEGHEISIEGVFPATLLFAILLGLAEVPDSISDIKVDCASFLEPPGTRKLAGE
jgi:hypothetical protein